MTGSSPSSAGLPSNGQAPAGRRAVGIILVVLMALCVLFVGGYLQRLSEKAAVEAEIVQMEQQIAEARVRNAILGKELAQVNDDAHVAAIARDALNLVQEGDQIITVVEAPAPQVQATPVHGGIRTPVNTEPNWRRWADLLFPAE